jgi:hypothetical protein
VHDRIPVHIRLISLTPCFSGVDAAPAIIKTVSIQRFWSVVSTHTSLKRGVNESGRRSLVRLSMFVYAGSAANQQSEDFRRAPPSEVALMFVFSRLPSILPP